jgi:hypothetical protein
MNVADDRLTDVVPCAECPDDVILQEQCRSKKIVRVPVSRVLLNGYARERRGLLPLPLSESNARKFPGETLRPLTPRDDGFEDRIGSIETLLTDPFNGGTQKVTAQLWGREGAPAARARSRAPSAVCRDWVAVASLRAPQRARVGVGPHEQ